MLDIISEQIDEQINWYKKISEFLERYSHLISGINSFLKTKQNFEFLIIALDVKRQEQSGVKLFSENEIHEIEFNLIDNMVLFSRAVLLHATVYQKKELSEEIKECIDSLSEIGSKLIYYKSKIVLLYAEKYFDLIKEFGFSKQDLYSFKLGIGSFENMLTQIDKNFAQKSIYKSSFQLLNYQTFEFICDELDPYLKIMQKTNTEMYVNYTKLRYDEEPEFLKPKDWNEYKFN